MSRVHPRTAHAATLAKSPPTAAKFAHTSRPRRGHATGRARQRLLTLAACAARAQNAERLAQRTRPRPLYMNNDEMKQLIQRGFTTLGVRTSVMAGVPTARATPP